MNPPNSLLMQANPNWTGYRCIACHQFWPHSAQYVDVAQGCPSCRQRGTPANFRCEYDKSLHGESSGFPNLSMPYQPTQHLGEGQTPLVAMPSDLGANGFFKLELANPTGSHKDRMAALALADAMARGKQKVLAASSGNAGVAIAAYAAMYGIECEIAVTQDCPELYLKLIRSYGAHIKTCASSMERWAYLEQFSKEPEVAVLTNFAVPAVGSPAVAIEAYKQIALELHQQIGAASRLGNIYLPVARGDLLWGLYMGFEHLLRTQQISVLPCLIAVEPFARLSRVLEGSSPHDLYDGKSKQSSVAGNTITLQSVLAIQRSGGTAIIVDDSEAIRARETLAKRGFLFELCAAAAWSAYEKVKTQKIKTQSVEIQRDRPSNALSQESSEQSSEQAVCDVVIATSHGSRDAHLFQ
jgi:threonine synthase